MDRKVAKRSAGVAPEVSLRNPLHTGEGSTLALKHRADVTRSPKQGYQWPHKKDLCPPKKNVKETKVDSAGVLTFLFDVNAVEGSGVVEGTGSEGVVVGHGAGLLPARRLVSEREAEFFRVRSVLGYVLDVPYRLTEPIKRFKMLSRRSTTYELFWKDHAVFARSSLKIKKLINSCVKKNKERIVNKTVSCQCGISFYQNNVESTLQRERNMRIYLW